MTLATLQQLFGTISDAPNGVPVLRKLVLQLAVHGRLVEQAPIGNARARLSQVETAEQSVPIGITDGSESAALLEDHAFQLPAGWKWAQLASLGTFRGGGTPSKADPTLWDGDIPWVSPKDMKRPRITDSIDHISKVALSRSAVCLIPEGAVLMVVRGMILAHTFPVAIADRVVTVNQDMKAIVLHDPRLAEFLHLALSAWESRVLRLVERSTHGTCRLRSELLETLTLPIPPAEEQRRIIAKVDELLMLCNELEKRQQRRADSRMRARSLTA